MHFTRLEVLNLAHCTATSTLVEVCKFPHLTKLILRGVTAPKDLVEKYCTIPHSHYHHHQPSHSIAPLPFLAHSQNFSLVNAMCENRLPEKLYHLDLSSVWHYKDVAAWKVISHNTSFLNLQQNSYLRLDWNSGISTLHCWMARNWSPENVMVRFITLFDNHQFSLL